MKRSTRKVATLKRLRMSPKTQLAFYVKGSYSFTPKLTLHHWAVTITDFSFLQDQWVETCNAQKMQIIKQNNNKRDSDQKNNQSLIFATLILECILNGFQLHRPMTKMANGSNIFLQKQSIFNLLKGTLL